jgi:hypothetical protein
MLTVFKEYDNYIVPDGWATQDEKTMQVTILVRITVENLILHPNQHNQ